MNQQRFENIKTTAKALLSFTKAHKNKGTDSKFLFRDKFFLLPLLDDLLTTCLYLSDIKEDTVVPTIEEAIVLEEYFIELYKLTNQEAVSLLKDTLSIMNKLSVILKTSLVLGNQYLGI